MEWFELWQLCQLWIACSLLKTPTPRGNLLRLLLARQNNIQKELVSLLKITSNAQIFDILRCFAIHADFWRFHSIFATKSRCNRFFPWQISPSPIQYEIFTILYNDLKIDNFQNLCCFLLPHHHHQIHCAMHKSYRSFSDIFTQVNCLCTRFVQATYSNWVFI